MKFERPQEFALTKIHFRPGYAFIVTREGRQSRPLLSQKMVRVAVEVGIEANKIPEEDKGILFEQIKNSNLPEYNPDDRGLDNALDGIEGDECRGARHAVFFDEFFQKPIELLGNRLDPYGFIRFQRRQLSFKSTTYH